MRKFILNIILLLAVAGAGVFAAWLVKSSEKGPDGPEGTITEFYSVLFSGKWDRATELCSENGSGEKYIADFRKIWESVRDSSVIENATEQLKRTGIEFTDKEKTDRNRLKLSFRLKSENGKIRDKVANLTKEGKEWLITDIETAK